MHNERLSLPVTTKMNNIYESQALTLFLMLGTLIKLASSLLPFTG
jgi:hypothetical protein